MLLSAALLLQASFAAASAETAPISETDSFFVCVGTYGAEEIPLLQYFQPSSSSGSRYKLRMYCFAGMDSAPAYGDIFIAEGGSFRTVPNNVPITRDKS